MPNANSALKINLLVMVLLSGLLLGWSMDSISIMVVSLIGATLGFLSILVLVMWDFFSVDGPSKLVSVATMLTYLINVLMFQRKTPRLNWQLLALSLLQVVLGAIFSLDFEAGMLFLGYFFVVIQRFQIESQNINSAKRAKRRFKAGGTNGSQERAKPLVFFDSSAQAPLGWKVLLRFCNGLVPHGSSAFNPMARPNSNDINGDGGNFQVR